MIPRIAILRAAGVFEKNPSASNEELRAAMLAAGLSARDTDDILEFVPLAFGRVLLDGMGIVFSEKYIRIDKNGQEIFRNWLEWEKFFREGLAAAPVVMMTSGKEAFTAIALRSSEVQAVNNALNAGASAENLQASLPVFFGPPRRKWWQLWG
jgi:hypothetical protein